MQDAQPADLDTIEPGMAVETTQGDLGEHDLSAPKIRDVDRDAAGNVQDVVVQKGVVFKKDIKVPADRISSVAASADASPGTVTIETNRKEIAHLASTGEEDLVAGDVLEQAQDVMPTAEGLRRKEGQTEQSVATPQAATAASPPESSNILKDLGPGLLAGMSGNDASAVTSYAIAGSLAGFSQLWLLLLATPLLQAVLYSCGKIGRVTQQGFAEVLRDHYGRKVAIPTALTLIVANVALIAADLVAIGVGIELITGVPWEWFVLPVAALLWYVTVYQNFDTIKKIFLVMSLAFVTYLVTGFLSGAHWGEVLRQTFVPQISLGFAGISSAVALLGATVSPYTMFWQVEGEKEEQRAGRPRQQIKAAALDIGVGVLSGNLVAYFIIVCTAATLFAHHQQITSAADAANALAPLVGPFAKYLFAVGLIGAGLVAVPVILASTAYAVSGTFGWTASLWRKPWQSEGFYLILTVALVVSLALAFLRINPIQLIFWANVLQGVLAPALVVLLIVVGNSRRVMHTFRLGKLTNIGLVVTALLLTAATVLLFYGLLTGQSR